MAGRATKRQVRSRAGLDREVRCDAVHSSRSEVRRVGAHTEQGGEHSARAGTGGEVRVMRGKGRGRAAHEANGKRRSGAGPGTRRELRGIAA